MSHTVYLGLGTNQGDRLANLQAACRLLAPSVRLLEASPVYQTEPWGFLDQPAFLNQALKTETDLPPLDLLVYLKDLERRLGRKPNFRYGPRLIDIDILLYDDLVLSLPGLEIPHPRLVERAFVLVPLVDLAPDLCFPGNGHSLQELLERTGRAGVTPFSNKGETSMSQVEPKPLKDAPGPEAGFTASRRPDGGMTIQFTNISKPTLQRWREFSLAHLENSDRLTTNLYDLRQIERIPEEAVRYALEVNSDPAVRNIRLAVVVANDKVADGIREIASLALPETAAAIKIFTDIDEAEAWLDRSLTLLV